MAQYILEIFIDAPEGSDLNQAREEIAGAIEDARDSEQLGGCMVTLGDLKEAPF